VLEQSKVQLLQANSTQIIKQHFKITIVYMQKVDHAKEAQQNKFLKLKVIIDSLENNAKKLSNDVEVNSAASSFLDRAFNLIEDVRSDLKDLEYAPTTLRDYSKYIDLTIGNKIESIKELLIKVERLIYTSS
jgi:1,4-dihydroxy-2-naphthoyl-CoA synthase